MIHHVSYEIYKGLFVQELEFWSMLGFNPCCFGPRRRTRKQTIIHWLTSGDESHAVELLPVEDPAIQEVGHLCYVLDQRTWENVHNRHTRFAYGCMEWASDYFGNKRRFLHSPSGNAIEILSGAPSLKAGPPLEEV
jgi:hypothetical protein